MMLSPVSIYLDTDKLTYRQIAHHEGIGAIATVRGRKPVAFDSLQHARRVATRIALLRPGVQLSFFLINPNARRLRYGIWIRREA